VLKGTVVAPDDHCIGEALMINSCWSPFENLAKVCGCSNVKMPSYSPT